MLRRLSAACLVAHLPVAACLVACLVVAAPSWAAAAARSPIRARLVCTDGRTEATDDFMWNVSFSLTNQCDRGIYCDSLVFDIEDLDPGVTHGPRHSRVVVTAVSRLIASLSAGDSTLFQVQIRATCEHARLSCRLFVHDVQHDTATFDAVTETDPSPVAVAHPSQMLKAPSGQVEYLSFPAPAESLGAAAVLLIHDDGEHARSLLPFAAWLAGRGYSVGVLSMPGYGRSEGEPDFTGPRALEALEVAFEALEHAPRVDSKRLAVWGVGRGASAAVLFAARHPEMRAVVAQSGAYDPASAEHIKAAVLLVHGEKDTRMPVAQAHAFAAALQAHRVDVESRFLPAGGATLQPFEVRRVALDFLHQHLAP